MVKRLIDRIKKNPGNGLKDESNHTSELRIENIDPYFRGILCISVEELSDGRKKVIVLPTSSVLRELQGRMGEFRNPYEPYRLASKYAQEKIGDVSRLRKDIYEVHVGEFTRS